MRRYILQLQDKRATQRHLSGGKGANLARLYQHGFHIPPGFVVTHLALQDHLQALGVSPGVVTGAVDGETLIALQTLLQQNALISPIEQEIAKAYRDLGGRVAVRSSMIAEDGTFASAAGQLRTILDVQDLPQLIEAIVHCWQALFSLQLSEYLDNVATHLDGGSRPPLAMAVVVQRLVEARSAGVAFSAHPTTGERCVLIEAAPGLGTAVVEGRSHVDRYQVDARGRIVLQMEVDAENPVLSPEEIQELSRLTSRIAAAMGAPQDVEWAKDGRFSVLQSRPITSLVGKKVYSNRMVADMSPGLIKPLVWTTKTVRVTENVFQRMFEQIIGQTDINYTELVRRIHSRAYTNVTLLGDILRRIGLPGNFFEMMMRDERSSRSRPRITRNTLPHQLRLIRFGWRQGRSAPEIERFVHQHNHQLESYRHADWASYSRSSLLADLNRLCDFHGICQWYIVIGSFNMAIRNRLLERFVRSRTPEIQSSDLIRGLVGLRSLEPNQEIRELAAAARRLDEDLERLLMEGTSIEISHALSQSPQGQELMAHMDNFLARFGFLSPNGTDFSDPPWFENPLMVWRAVGRSMRAQPPGDHVSPEMVRRQTRDAVRQKLKPWERAYFDRILAATLVYIDLRERLSFLMSENTLHMRRIVMTMAKKLVTDGVLLSVDDIFYLQLDELKALVDGDLAPEDARDLVQAQRTEMEFDRQVILPDIFCDTLLDKPYEQEAELPLRSSLHGIACSPGVVTGFARVILEPTAAPPDLSREDILIVPFTDIGWTPLFSYVGGIVAETGGQLSHTAIIAREYSVPAVVSVIEATRVIPDGCLITLDGTAGRVHIHSPQAQQEGA